MWPCMIDRILAYVTIVEVFGEDFVKGRMEQKVASLRPAWTKTISLSNGMLYFITKLVL